MNANNTVIALKKEAKNLSQILNREFGQTISHSKALEFIAQVHGYPNWDTAVAKVDVRGVSAAAPLSRHDQLWQLIAIRDSLKNKARFGTTLELLKSQPNAVAAAGWKQVSVGDGADIGNVLIDSQLFDADVVNIFHFVHVEHDLCGSFNTCIEYLKSVNN